MFVYRNHRPGVGVTFALIQPNGKWSTIPPCATLSALKDILKVKNEVQIFALQGRTFRRVIDEAAFQSLRTEAGAPFVQLKLGSVTPDGSPKQLIPADEVVLDLHAVSKQLFRHSEISVLYRDGTMKETIDWLHEDFTDRRVAMIQAPPGSGKTRTPLEAAKEAKAEYLRVKLSTSAVLDGSTQSVNQIKASATLGLSKEAYKALLHPPFRSFVKDWILQAEKLHTEDHPIVLLHVDEIQVFLPKTAPPHNVETALADSVGFEDIILLALADVIQSDIMTSLACRGCASS